MCIENHFSIFKHNRIWPVSYTHLDVYKRQALNVDTYHGMVRLVRIVLAITLGFEAAGAIISFFVFRKDYSPVSYTHLDVYKRQVL